MTLIFLVFALNGQEAVRIEQTYSTRAACVSAGKRFARPWVKRNWRVKWRCYLTAV